MTLKHYQKQFLQYKYTTIMQDENRLIVRVLIPIIHGNVTCHTSMAFTTTKLLREYILIDNQEYVVAAEGVFDLNNHSHQQWWKLGERIVFYADVSSINKGIIQVMSVDRLMYNLNCNIFDYCEKNGYQLFGGILCTDPQNNIIESDKFIVTDVRGALYTNLTQRDEETAEIDYQVVGDDIPPFDIEYIICHPSTIKPNKTCECFITVGCGDKNINGTLYLDAHSGYLPKTTVEIRQGRGKFIVSSLLLNQEEHLVVGCGTKFDTQKALADILCS